MPDCVVFHPDQIAPINNAITPNAVAGGNRFVAAFREAAARCEAWAPLDREVTTMDFVPREKRIIVLAVRAAAL